MIEKHAILYQACYTIQWPNSFLLAIAYNFLRLPAYLGETDLDCGFTCVWNSEPPSKEVESAIGGAGSVAGQGFEVGLSREAIHKVRWIRWQFAIVKSVGAVREGI